MKMLLDTIFCGTRLKLYEKNIIAVDFDGVLAEQMVPYDPRRAGPPLNLDNKDSMVNKVRQWIKQGKKVVILTARVNTKTHTPEQLKYTNRLIGQWCKTYLGKRLPITSEKHSSMSVMYDDRAVSVDPKTGKIN